MDQNVSQDKNPVNVTEVAESDHNDVQDAFHPSLISTSTPESRSRNAEHLNTLLTELAKVAPVDYMLNSAGIARDSLLIAHASQDIENVISTNLMGTIWLNKAVAKGMMRRKRGAIINISSVVGLHGNIGQSVYSASKSAIIGFSKSLSKELGSRNITVNVIAPGYIDTDMTPSIPEDRKQAIVAKTSLGRLGQADDVAEAALFLAQAKFITGQVLVVDGGLSL